MSLIPEEDDFEAAEVIRTVPQSTNETRVVRLGAKVLETKKSERKILPEEVFVDNMQKIIVRDYFPELPKLKAQAEYLDAVAKNDTAKIRELQVRYSSKRTDRRTSPSARPKSPKSFNPATPGPSNDETDLPFSNVEGDNEPVVSKKKKKIIDNLSLQKYVDRYTSEDNASFEELATMHQRRERIKNSWMYEAEEKHNNELVWRTKDPLSVLPADEHALAVTSRERERPNNVDNWDYKARNSVLFFPEDAPLTVEEHMKRQKSEKIINKEATRINEKIIQQPHQSSMARAAMHHAVVNSGLVDISGKDLGIVSATTLGCVATPTPAPGVDESPLMTWGEIEGTPFRLDGADIAAPVSDDAPTFKIPEIPLRERIAQDLTDKLGKRFRDKRKIAIEQAEKMHSKTPKFGSTRSMDKLLIMSPAARRLATNKLGIRIGTDKLVRGSPRGTPSSTRSGIYSPALYKSVKTKKEIKEEPRSNPSTPRGSITDNLLHLPSPSAPSVVDPSTRPSASDFF